jgi:23S rRNA (pseudouridine1915-N3)-methyltransferase
MRIHLLAVGEKPDAWVSEGYREFAKRLPPECALHLTEVPAGRRGRNADIARLMTQEGERLLQAAPAGARVLALDVRGQLWSTEELATRMARWMQEGRDLAIMIGGPDGLAPACLERAELRWSLSPLTLPHALVRILVAEQLYRAWSICRGHPYHRG